MRSVLMISPRFPPVATAGVYRSVRFCRHLPSFGWRPVVLTTGYNDPFLAFYRDDTLIRKVPKNVNVYRVDYPDRTIWRKSERVFHRWRLWRLREWLMAHFDFPCEYRDWARVAYKTCLQLVDKEDINLIYCSMNPWSTWLLANRLSLKTGLPWVADFRDPWSYNMLRFRNLSPRRKKREESLEARLVSKATHIVMAHPKAVELMRVRYAIPATKITAITNGYDPLDFNQPAELARRDGRLTVVHVGTGYKDNSPAPLFRALEYASKIKSDILPSLCFRFVGGCPIPLPNLPELQVDVMPRVHHDRAIDEMRSADVLLIVWESTIADYHIPGKLFEYLAVRRPILAIIPASSDTARIIRETKRGIVVDPDSPDDIVGILAKWVVKKPEIWPDDAAVLPYSAKVLSGRLANIFDRLTC